MSTQQTSLLHLDITSLSASATSTRMVMTTLVPELSQPTVEGIVLDSTPAQITPSEFRELINACLATIGSNRAAALFSLSMTACDITASLTHA
ncbi:hypothetical protein ACPV5S_15825 [Vibrio astriarenae]